MIVIQYTKISAVNNRHNSTGKKTLKDVSQHNHGSLVKGAIKEKIKYTGKLVTLAAIFSMRCRLIRLS